MKIDKGRLKKSTSEVPAECQALISKLRGCDHKELMEELKKIDTWTYGKCELYHWIDILDIHDTILERASAREGNSWTLACDLPENSEDKEILLWTLHFTTLLIEHSFSRHLYSSMEHLTTLLQSCDLNVVLGVLNLLYMFSKRSNFLTRLPGDKRNALLTRLIFLAETWGGKDNGFGLADCSRKEPAMTIPKSVTTLDFEFYVQQPNDGLCAPRGSKSLINMQVIHLDNIDKMGSTPSAIMDSLMTQFDVPEDRQVQLFTRLRLACNFSKWSQRLLIVQARLQALSVLVYSNALSENPHSMLYNGLLEELVELLELQLPYLMEIRAAALRTLTSIIHLDRNPHFPKKPGSRLGMIIEVTGASSYHGFLPALVRTCIGTLTSAKKSSAKAPVLFPLPLATALFSFLYHLASYEAGGEALVSCGMMESLLRVINWQGKELEHITFVTRAVRVIDLITNMDMQAFQIHGGLSSFIRRLEMEVNVCRVEQPFEIVVPSHFNEQLPAMEEGASSGDERPIASEAGPSGIDGNGDIPMQTEDAGTDGDVEMPSVDTPSAQPNPIPSGSNQLARLIPERETARSSLFNSCPLPEPKRPPKRVYGFGGGLPDFSASKTGKTCLPQRAALLKSMLNFLKKAIQDPAFSDSIRHVMEGTLPSSLRHIISNAEYYGPSLFLLATDVVTVYVFQEPSLLSSLQDNGLTDVVLHALLIKDVPATREVLGSLPNVFSALCLNARGLESFVKCEPFERLFKVLLSPAYLTAMRRRRSSDPLGDTASNLGNAMDELMRHQPSLKVDATYAMIRLLEELNSLGNNPNYVCWRATKGVSDTPSILTAGNNSSRTVPNDTGSSEDEDEDEDEASSSSHPQREDTTDSGSSTTSTERTPIALIDYIVNVMKFIDAILSNNATDDHCKEFIKQNGLPPLMAILALKNLPVDYPITVSAQAVAAVCKSILNLAHEPNVLNILMQQMSEVIEMVSPLNDTIKPPGGSILLRELANAPNLETAFSTASATPVLHAVNAMHSYITTFIHTCRTAQSEIRAISLRIWGSGTGIDVITGLANMYVSVVWESNALLALCTDDVIPLDSGFAAEDLAKLRPAEAEPTPCSSSDAASNGMTSAMEALSTDPPTQMDVDESFGSEKSKEGSRILPTPAQLKYIKLILAVTSRLARSLAELFGLLVKLCMGPHVRTRRGQPVPALNLPPSPHARTIAGALNKLLAKTLSWDKLPPTVIPKFTLTFLICSIGFASPMLFDDKKYPFHLMLHKFLKHGGQQTFFNSIRWALSAGNTIDPSEGLEHPDLPEGTGDFLVSSLTLLEKLVNPKAILESPHAHSTTARSSFDTIKYLMHMHQEAFKVIMLFWGKKPLKGYTDHMCDSMLSILRHILRGEKLLLERLEKERASLESAEAGASTSASGSGSESGRAPKPHESNVNPVDLVRLLEMGFPRVMCVEALLSTSTVDQAMDHILSGGTAPYEGTSEEEQMHQAVLMSLGVSTKPVAKSRSSQLEEDMESITKFQQVIDTFTDKALSTCLELLDLLPDSVFRVCDLLVTITKRNGESWREDMLDALIVEICHKCEYLMHAFADHPVPADLVDDLVNSQESQQFAVRIHLFTLLFEGPLFNEMRLPCALAAQNSYIIPMLVRMVYRSQEVLTQSGQKVTPKWLAPVLLLIDQYEQISAVTKRKERMHEVTNRIWRWFDLSTGKWTAYSIANNKLINDAYWSGFNTVRISCGRRRYTIQFHVMMQVNEESGNRRPIMMSLIEREKAEGRPDKKPEGKDSKVGDLMDIEEEKSAQRALEEQRNVPIMGVQDELAKKLVGACVGLLCIPVDKHAVHAVMRVCLRLTQNYENAIIFANKGGISSLLGLTSSESFVGFLNLATLLIRHVIEEPSMLGMAMEKVLRGRTLNNIPPPYKELVYLLRNTSAAVTRDPQTFLEVARKVLRIDCNVARRDPDDKDNGLLLKTLPPSPEIHPVSQFTHEVTASAISQLLNALARNHTPVYRSEETETAGASTTGTTSAGVSTNLSVAQNPTQLTRTPNAFTPHVSMIFSTFRQNASHILGVTDETIIEREFIRKKKDDVQSSDEEKHKLLLPKSAILKLLADTVRSYAGCAKLIVDHMFYINQSEVITEDSTALAFILDNLLPVGETSEDRECSTMSRMLIASIASCNHSPDAQTALVTEVRNSMVRAFALPESSAKHIQIQLLSGLISTMVENCPQNPPTPTPTFNHMLRVQPYGHHVNNIVKIIFRSRLFADLSKVAHHLDLSSPHMAATLNASLKPLETVSRIINQPTASVPKPKPKNQNVGEPAGERPGAAESNRSNGDRDIDNMDHLLGPSGSRPTLGEERISMTRMVNALMERVPEPEEANYEEPEPRPIRPMEIDTDTDHNPNAGLNDSNPLFDNNPVAEDPEDTQEESSESESESNEEASDGDAVDETREVEDDEEDDGDDNEEEDEEEEEEEEEEGGSAYDDDGLEFFESDEGLFRLPGLDRENEDILMIQYSDTTDTGVGSLVPWNSSAFPLPFGIFDDPSNGNGNDSGDGGLVDGLVNHTTPPHPLLLSRHHLEGVNVPVGPRSQRISANRPRRYQFVTLTGNTRHPNPPVILQRLLGPGGHNVPAHIEGGPPLRDIRDTRVVVMDNGLGIFSNEEEQIDFVDQSGYLFGPGLSATLNNPPTALHWWIEEAKLLDGESQPDCVVAIANDLIPELEKHREIELVKRLGVARSHPEDEEDTTVKGSSPPADLSDEFIDHVLSMEVPSTSSSVPAEVDPLQLDNTTEMAEEDRSNARTQSDIDSVAIMETMESMFELENADMQSPPTAVNHVDGPSRNRSFLEALARDRDTTRRRDSARRSRDPRLRPRPLLTPESLNDAMQRAENLSNIFGHYTPDQPLPPFIERHFLSRPDSAESPPLLEDRHSSPSIPPPPPLIPVQEMMIVQRNRLNPNRSPPALHVIPPPRPIVEQDPFADCDDAEVNPFAMSCETSDASGENTSPAARLLTAAAGTSSEAASMEQSDEAQWNSRVISPILSSRRPRPGARSNRTNRPMRDTAADSRRATPPWRRTGPSWAWARPESSASSPRHLPQQNPRRMPQEPADGSRHSILDAEFEDAVMRVMSQGGIPDETAARVTGWPEGGPHGGDQSEGESDNRGNDSQNVNANDSQESIVYLGSVHNDSALDEEPNLNSSWSQSQESVVCLGSVTNDPASEDQESEGEPRWFNSQESVVCLGPDGFPSVNRGEPHWSNSQDSAVGPGPDRFQTGNRVEQPYSTDDDPQDPRDIEQFFSRNLVPMSNDSHEFPRPERECTPDGISSQASTASTVSIRRWNISDDPEVIDRVDGFPVRRPAEQSQDSLFTDDYSSLDVRRFFYPNLPPMSPPSSLVSSTPPSSTTTLRESQSTQSPDDPSSDENISAQVGCANPNSRRLLSEQRLTEIWAQQDSADAVEGAEAASTRGDGRSTSPIIRCRRHARPLFAAPLRLPRHAHTLPSVPPVQAVVDVPEAEPEDIVDAVDGPSTSAGATANSSEVPEGVDPSFLAALPEEMRHEVISEHLQLQRILQQTQAEGEEPLTDVNPEFLAALPPSIQEEVLAQQRQELQRQAAIAANPEDPVDAAAFFENLPGPLRQAILTDMEDSQIAVLPPDLALEAQNLRREWESRNRQAMQDRLLNQQHNNTALTSILRNTGAGVGRGPRYSFHTVPNHGNTAMTNGWHSRTDPLATSTGGLSVQGQVRVRGRHLLDHESLSCLMVLLFVDEPKLNTGRLHRVFRNLCYHSPTRDWVVKTLLSIMDRCNESLNPDNWQMIPRRRMSTRSQGPANREANREPQAPVVPATAYVRTATPSWLNISLEAALGCRASVFTITRHQGKRGSKGQEAASIHPSASPLVFRHSLDTLISLAKSFPGYFLPHKKEEKREGADTPLKTYPTARDIEATTSKKDPSAETKKPSTTAPRALRTTSTDFWENLIKLDSPASYKKGKTMARSTSILMVETSEPTPPASFETCAFGLLIQMLASPVVKRSTVLTDKLLRLLSLISVGLPDCQDLLTVHPLEGSSDEVRVHVIVMPERYLRLAVEVLTLKSCSEEGLEDITGLLLNLSASPESSRPTILRLLLEGAKQLANVVKENIATLLVELKAMNEQMKRESLQDPETHALDRERPTRGVVNDRFTKTDVVVSAPTKLKGGCDLQLPSMAVLTTKTSSQAFFLRILKIVVQIRESTLPILKKRREARDLYPGLMQNCKDEDLVLPSLSEQLPLDSLWETLGDCLTELNDTPDHHAVLVLQPAVEAFFIVHAALTEERSEPADLDASQDSEPEENAEPSESPTNETPAVVAETVSTSIQPDPTVSERANQSDMPQASLARNVAPVSPLQSDGESLTSSQRVESASQFFMRSTTLGISVEQSQPPVQLPPDQQKFLKFAETHRTVLNQILRQSTTHLADGPFAVLVDHTRVLDFDVKRNFFRAELERKDEGVRREELAVHVRRSHVFEDSFRELHRRSPDEWKNRFYIVFEGEEGQDAGGLLREWYVIISREIFNPMYALFTTSHSDRVTYMINPASNCNPNHLSYFKFVGRVIAKAVYDNKLLECYFTRSFYKHILGILVKFSDMESEDYSFYQGLIFLMEHNVQELGYDLMFTAEVQVFGAHETRDLMPGGSLVRVTEENKLDYVRLVCKMKMADAIRKQIQAFLEGFYEIIPKRLIAIFNEQELELLISGLPNIDIEDLRSNTEYHKYQPTSLQIQWFWRALRSFDQADRAKFLQFVTGTSKVPLQGFGSLEGMNGVQKFQIHRDDRSTDRLPSAHTCFNQLDLPVYETYVKLSTYLLKAIHECSEGFGFA